MGLYKKIGKYLPKRFERLRRYKRPHFYADGLGVRNKNLSFLDDPKFSAAWNFAEKHNRDGWNGNPPDLRWRAWTCCWAARIAMGLPGDFVECGVHTGLLSMTVCHYLDFEKLDRKFYLYDTYSGIPKDELKGEEQQFADEMNAMYFNVWEIAQRNFAQFENANLIQGILPDSLDHACPEKISYLSIDLNSATFELETIRKLWDRIVPGAVIVIDDYGFVGHEAQYKMWNDWASDHNTAVLYLPTGQGVIVKSAQSMRRGTNH